MLPPTLATMMYKYFGIRYKAAGMWMQKLVDDSEMPSLCRLADDMRVCQNALSIIGAHDKMNTMSKPGQAAWPFAKQVESSNPEKSRKSPEWIL